MLLASRNTVTDCNVLIIDMAAGTYRETLVALFTPANASCCNLKATAKVNTQLQLY